MYNHGFVRVAAAVPIVKVADCFYNAGNIERMIKEASEKGASIVAFPELSVSGYSCMDLFSQQILLENAKKALKQIIDNTATLDIISIVGLPLEMKEWLLNVAVVFQKGKILGIVPKTYLPNYREFQEKRWFASASVLEDEEIRIFDQTVKISNHIVF
jgi:NAD+ synthase (glutamine-hydrolysing)